LLTKFDIQNIAGGLFSSTISLLGNILFVLFFFVFVLSGNEMIYKAIEHRYVFNKINPELEKLKAEIKKDARYLILPAWITNITRSGDTFNDFNREMFCSGKHYLPSDQLPAGHLAYGTGKNLTIIRYAEILLMYAEALTNGASGSVMTADDAVNLVRARAGLQLISGVTNAQVMDEKFAELAMEWGTRYYDLVRLGRYMDLSYDGRTFTTDKIFYPYPRTQVEQIPILAQ